MDILDRKFRFLYKNHKTHILLIFYPTPSLLRLRTAHFCLLLEHHPPSFRLASFFYAAFYLRPAPVCPLPDHHSPSFRPRLVLLSCILSSDGSRLPASRTSPTLIPPSPRSSLLHFIFGRLSSARHSRLVLRRFLSTFSDRTQAQSSEIILPSSPCCPPFGSSARFQPPPPKNSSLIGLLFFYPLRKQWYIIRRSRHIIAAGVYHQP